MTDDYTVPPSCTSHTLELLAKDFVRVTRLGVASVDLVHPELRDRIAVLHIWGQHLDHTQHECFLALNTHGAIGLMAQLRSALEQRLAPAVIDQAYRRTLTVVRARRSVKGTPP